MIDVAMQLDNRPGALAEMGEILGRAGISIEGGGVFSGNAHFLFHDRRAADVLCEGGIRVVAVSEVVALRLRQDEPGQLGGIARRMAEAGVNIEVQYSDHDHRLILVVDDRERARAIAGEWMAHAADAK
jgi:hypothetical protein